MPVGLQTSRSQPDWAVAKSTCGGRGGVTACVGGGWLADRESKRVRRLPLLLAALCSVLSNYVFLRHGSSTPNQVIPGL